MGSLGAGFLLKTPATINSVTGKTLELNKITQFSNDFFGK